MKKLFLLLQELIKIGLFFLIAYVWLSYTLSDHGFVIVLSLAISLFLEVLTFMISKKNISKKQLKVSQQTDAENMFLSLTIDKTAINFFYNMFSSRHKKVTLKQDHLIIENQEGERTLFFPFLKINHLQIDDVLSISKLHSNINKIVIVCNEYDPSCTQYTQQINCKLVLLNKYDTYLSLYKEYEYYPDKVNRNIKKEWSIKTIFQSIFNKSKAKGYIFGGTILLLSSLYVPFSIYYKIVASLLFILALLCLLSPGINTKKELV